MKDFKVTIKVEMGEDAHTQTIDFLLEEMKKGGIEFIDLFIDGKPSMVLDSKEICKLIRWELVPLLAKQAEHRKLLKETRTEKGQETRSLEEIKNNESRTC